jgi:ribosomal protein S6--L-glutamate ligase
MRIGILSGHPKGAAFENNMRLMDEAKKVGAEAVVINYKKTVAAIRGYGRQLLAVGDGGSLEPIEVDVIIPRIGKDVESGIRAIDVLTSNGIPTTAPSSAVSMAKDKFASLVQLDRGGVPVPYSVAPTGQTPAKSAKMIELIQPEKSKPVIVKSLRGSKGRGVFLSESRRSAVSQVEGLASNDVDYLVQEFIDPPSDEKRPSDVRIFVVDGEVVAAMERTAAVEDEFRSNLDLGGNAHTYEPTPREREIALRSAEIIGARIVGFDGMHSYRGMLATEVNVNPGLGIEEVTGINVAGAMVDLAIKMAEQRHGGSSLHV